MMANEAFLSVASSAYSICEAQCMGATRAVEQPRAPININDVRSDAWRKFSIRLLRLLKKTSRLPVENVAILPSAVPGEIIASSLVGLNRLRATGGSMPAPDGYQREFQLKQV
jgi:hypothetical protein